MFLLIAVPVAFLLHIWVCRQLTKPASMEGLKRPIWMGLSVLFALILIAPISWRFGRSLGSFAWWGLRVAYLAMGFYSFVLGLLIIKGLTWQGLRVLSLKAPILPEDQGRRDLIARGLNLSVLGGAVGASAVGYQEAMRRARVVEVPVKVKGLPEGLEGFRIVQLSDIHVGPTIKRPYLQAIVDKVNELGADIVCLTGDLVDARVHQITEDVAPFATLKSKYGVFACTGNHEYYSGALEWIAQLRKMGVQVLLNEGRIIEHHGRRLLLGGATDYSAERFVKAHRTDPAACLRGVGACDFKLLMAHQPRSIYAAQKAGFDLMLAGHTHGGQFFPWNLVVHLAQPFVAGLERYKDTQIYVSRGTGYFGPPFRMMAPSEITLLKLSRDSVI